MQESIDIQIASQRLFALSRKNQYSLPVNNLAQAQFLINAILGIDSGSGELRQALEAEADCLIETARANGYRVHKEVDKNQNIAYLELIAGGADQQSRRIKAVAPEDIHAMLKALRPSTPGPLTPSLCKFKPADLVIGHVATNGMLKRREAVLAQAGRIIFSIGDSGAGHLNRASNIIGQALSAGRPVLAFDFIPEKLDFVTFFKRSVDSSRRNRDFFMTSGDLNDGNVTAGSFNWMTAKSSITAWHYRVFNNDAGYLEMAKLLHALQMFVSVTYPQVLCQYRWLEVFSSLENVLGLVQDHGVSPDAALLIDIENALKGVLSIKSIREISSEHSTMYADIWANWLTPFEKLAEKHQAASEKRNADFVNVTKANNVVFTSIGSAQDLGARNVRFQVARQLEGLRESPNKPLVALRVSGSGMQSELVIEMTKRFGALGYQLLIIIDGQSAKASLVAQKLSMLSKADCLWHLCNIPPTAAFRIDLSGVSGTQCLLVNREVLKEPLMLLPSG